MTIEHITDQESLMHYVNWALETNLWNGREISLNGVNDFKEEAMENIVKTLFSQSEDSYEFQKMAAELAYFGAKEGEEGEILAELESLRAYQNGVVIPVGFSKTLKRFWKRHKVAILVGAAVVAVVTAVAVGVFCAAGVASAAGGVLIPDKDKKQKEPPKPVSPAQQDTSAKPPEALRWPQTDLSLGKDTIFLNGQQLSYNEALQPKTLAETLYSQASFKEDLARYKQYDTPYQERPTQISSQEAAVFTSMSLQTPLSVPMFSELPVYSSKDLPPVTGKLAWIGKMVDWSQSESDLETASPLPQIQNATTHLFRTPGEIRRNVCILGMNGICTHLYESIYHAEYLAQFTRGLSLGWVHNHSNTLPADVGECALNFAGISINPKSVLRNSCLAFHEANKDNPEAKLLLFLHSQGTIHGLNTLESLPPEVRNRLIVVSIAPAAIIPRDLCYRSYVYASKSDAVYLAESSCKGLICDALRLEALQKLTNVIFLEPHEEASWFDHDFESPTFRDVIIQNINKYLLGDT